MSADILPPDDFPLDPADPLAAAHRHVQGAIEEVAADFAAAGGLTPRERALRPHLADLDAADDAARAAAVRAAVRRLMHANRRWPGDAKNRNPGYAASAGTCAALLDRLTTPDPTRTDGRTAAGRAVPPADAGAVADLAEAAAALAGVGGRKFGDDLVRHLIRVARPLADSGELPTHAEFDLAATAGRYRYVGRVLDSSAELADELDALLNPAADDPAADDQRAGEEPVGIDEPAAGSDEPPDGFELPDDAPPPLRAAHAAFSAALIESERTPPGNHHDGGRFFTHTDAAIALKDAPPDPPGWVVAAGVAREAALREAERAGGPPDPDEPEPAPRRSERVAALTRQFWSLGPGETHVARHRAVELNRHDEASLGATLAALAAAFPTVAAAGGVLRHVSRELTERTLAGPRGPDRAACATLTAHLRGLLERRGYDGDPAGPVAAPNDVEASAVGVLWAFTEPDGPPPLTPGEPWTDDALALFFDGFDGEPAAAEDPAAWVALLEHARSRPQPRPTGKWLKEAAPLIEVVGPEAVRAAICRWFRLTAAPRTWPVPPEEEAYRNAAAPRQADALKGFAWLLPGLTGLPAEAREAAEALETLAAVSFAGGRTWVRVGGAAVAALAALPERTGVPALERLRDATGTMRLRTTLDKALAAA